MDRESLIRRLKQRAPDAAFALLLAAGMVTGGGAALGGLEHFLNAALPGMEAQAKPEAYDDGPSHGVARLAMAGFAPSRYAPQLLYPVATNPLPPWLTEAMPGVRLTPPSLPPAAVAPRIVRRPVIAICIDDLGEDIAGTDKAMALPQAVALSFLPYAETTPFLAEAAGRKGHLILAHVPMQAVGATDPGPMALKTGMAPDEIARRVSWNLSRVPGIVGINNHEGSRFTADAAALAPVMAALKARHLFFFDSRTGADTKVAQAADAAGVMTAGRDVFLDDDQSEAAVKTELEVLATTAKRTGVAIAIGHPHDVTLKLLAEWLKQDHGVTLLPLDEAMRVKANNAFLFATR